MNKGHLRMQWSRLQPQFSVADAFCNIFALSYAGAGVRLVQQHQCSDMLPATAEYCTFLSCIWCTLQMFPNLTIKVSEYHTNDGR